MSLIKITFWLIALAVIVTAVQAWQWYGHGQDRVYFLDVGQGDASLVIKSERCHRLICQWASKLGVPWYQKQIVLIDGGPDDAVVHQLATILPWWQRQLDLVALSHPHQDHLTGLISITNRFNVKYVVLYPVPHPSHGYGWLLQQWRICGYSRIAQSHFIPHQASSVQAEVLNPSDLAEYFPWIAVYWPRGNQLVTWDQANQCWRTPSYSANAETVNNDSLVFQVKVGASMPQKVLFTGDIEASAEKILTGDDRLQSNYLKAPHQCSRSSSTEAFIRTVNPQVVVCSVGKNNPYGHPSVEVIARYRTLGATVYRTDKHGTIYFAF